MYNCPRKHNSIGKIIRTPLILKVVFQVLYMYRLVPHVSYTVGTLLGGYKCFKSSRNI